MRVLNQPLPGIFVIQCTRFCDHRGDFTKVFHINSLVSQGIAFSPAESFLTRSQIDVLRGMHYQDGEAAHDKLVMCIKGRVLDVVVDFRRNSPYFNQPFAIELTENCETALFIGKGYAHGFLTLEEDSWMLYYTSTIHSPSDDRGILWSSIAFDWPIHQPVLSNRDGTHPSINELS